MPWRSAASRKARATSGRTLAAGTHGSRRPGRSRFSASVTASASLSKFASNVSIIFKLHFRVCLPQLIHNILEAAGILFWVHFVMCQQKCSGEIGRAYWRWAGIEDDYIVGLGALYPHAPRLISVSDVD